MFWSLDDVGRNEKVRKGKGSASQHFIRVNKLLKESGYFFGIRNVLQLNVRDCLQISSLRFTHFSPMFHFLTPWKRQKIFGLLTFSGGIEMEHWAKMGLAKLIELINFCYPWNHQQKNKKFSDSFRGNIS